jgi:hypothetical protein
MEPTTPALHWAITNLGVLKMNIGEAMTGNLSDCNTRGKRDISNPLQSSGHSKCPDGDEFLIEVIEV